MLEQLLAEGFYTAFGYNPYYQVVTAFSITTANRQPHHSAWFRCKSGFEQSTQRDGLDCRPFTSYLFACECYFRLGIGWRWDLPNASDQRRGVQLTQPYCPHRWQTLQRHYRQLQQGYQSLLTGPGDQLINHLKTIVRDLQQRSDRGEFVSESAPLAHAHGAAFSVGTLVQIVERTPEDVYASLDPLIQAGITQLCDEFVGWPIPQQTAS